MKSNWFNKIEQDPKTYNILQKEQLVLEVTELICGIMENKKISRSNLANKIGLRTGELSQLLDGEADMDLTTLANIMTALNYKLSIDAVPLK